MSEPLIHPTAIISPQAELAADVRVGPYSIIGPKVKIGAGSSIGPHCVIDGPTVMGARNSVYAYCSLGAVPQDKKYKGEDTTLEIGDDNTIREFCTFNRGTAQGGGSTTVGNRNWIMAYVHLAHDCHVMNDTIFANNAQLAGHVDVHDFAILGGFTVVHQFVRIGAHVITGMGSIVFKDIPPFVMAQGNLAKPYGLNSEGLKRRGFSAERISAIKRAYRALYREDLTFKDAIAAIDAQAELAESAQADVKHFADFLRAAKDGVLR
jgi:UDP-N-acetylglucosamine acyltransferase